MFARKDIAKGEQITFDYCRQTINSFGKVSFTICDETM